MKTEKERAFLIHLCYITVIICFLYCFFRYILYEIFPFFLGFLIAFSLRPLIRNSVKLCPFPQKLVSLFFLILFYGTIGTTITLLSIRCFRFLSSFIIQFPSLYENDIAPMLYQGFIFIEANLTKLFDTSTINWEQLYSQMSDTLRSFAISFSASLFSMIKALAASLPSILLSFFITLLSSIFFTLDFPKLSQFIMRQIPKEKHEQFYRIRVMITDTILNYLFAYGKLMIITFIELAIGLSYLHVDHAIPIALLISFFDIFPILGTGTILYPWICIAIFHRQIKFAVGLVILHLIINLIRQFVEPKIVGKQLGVHPLVMLACMFFGIKLFGFLGIFITPILVQLFCRLNHEGFIHVYHEIT